MKEFEYDNFVMFIAGVAETFGHTLTDAQIDLYFEVLSEEFEDIDEFKKAAKKLLKSWKYSYMPKPAHFIESKKEFSELEVEIIAQKAWDSVVYAIEQGVGYTKTAEFEDGLIPAVVELTGGFERLATKSYQELEWVKKEFIKTYKAAFKGEVKLASKEVRAIIIGERLLIRADYPTKTQKATPIKHKQNRATQLIAELTKAKRIAG